MKQIHLIYIFNNMIDEINDTKKDLIINNCKY